MKKTFKVLICIGVLGVIAILFFGAKNSNSNLNNESRDIIETPYMIHVEKNEQGTITVPEKYYKYEFIATEEEFKNYFRIDGLLFKTKNIVIIGEKVADDSKDIKWTIYQ